MHWRSFGLKIHCGVCICIRTYVDLRNFAVCAKLFEESSVMDGVFATNALCTALMLTPVMKKTSARSTAKMASRSSERENRKCE